MLRFVPFACTVTAALLLLSMIVSPILADDGEAARIAVFESSLRPGVGVEGQPEQRWTLAERMEHWKVPGLGIAVIRDGRLAWARGYGVLQAGDAEKVETETVFSVGSVSKVGTAATALRLVDAGRLDLDRDVNSYLKGWKVPDNFYTFVRPVTLRGIMSHTAGLSVHGFADFQPGEALPGTLDILHGKPPAKNDPVTVIEIPGSRYRYSGGGTMVEQLIVEEATGSDFPTAAQRLVFEPLGMTRSTYRNPLPPEHGNIAKAHGPDGKPAALPRGYETMPEAAASGLWSTPSDFAKLVIALIRSSEGEEGSFLSGPLAREMMSEVRPGSNGLGPALDGEGIDRRFSHGGANDSYRAWIEGHLGTGNGVVIFTNGANGLQLIAEVRRAVALAEGWSAALSNHVTIPKIAFTAGELTERAGTYAVQKSPTDGGGRYGAAGEPPFRFTARDGKLFRFPRRGNGDLMPLTPMDTARFVDDDGVVFEFDRSYSGAIESLSVMQLQSKEPLWWATKVKQPPR